MRGILLELVHKFWVTKIIHAAESSMESLHLWNIISFI